MKYLIFSDESGKWNENNYYIRSWIKITPENYRLLQKEIIFSKYDTKVKELKWEKFRKNYIKFKDIFSVDFDIFLTISKTSHFHAIKYSVIKMLETIKIPTGGEKITEAIKSKIIDSAKYTLFLNYFEKIHIETSKKALLPAINSSDYKYIIDNPQYLDKDWIAIANECGISQIEIEKESETDPGIEIADIISGCVSDLILKKNNADSIYKDCIKNKMLDMTSKSFPNPNLIFYDAFDEAEKNELNVFR